MLRLPKLSPRTVFTRREPRGVLDDDLLPERCDITSPTIAPTDSVLKFKLDGSLLEFIWLGVDIQNAIQRFKQRNYSQWRRKCSQSVKVSKLNWNWTGQINWTDVAAFAALNHCGAKQSCRDIKFKFNAKKPRWNPAVTRTKLWNLRLN